MGNLLAGLNPNYWVLLPEIVLLAVALVVLVADLYSSNKRTLAVVSLVGVLGAGLALWPASQQPFGQYFANTVTHDGFSLFLKGLFVLVAALIILLSLDFVEQRLPNARVEYYEVLLFITIGMMLMVSSLDLLLIFIALELASIASYVLAALMRRDARSNEAGLKYFLNGAFASAILLFGISLLFGITQTTHLAEMAVVLGNLVGDMQIVAYVGMIFMLAGFSFKIAAAPAHLWSPDVYEGAPTPVTTFFAIGPKAAMVGVMLRFFLVGLPSLASEWTLLIAVIATASMFAGNLVALWQKNFKRLMAYSAIAQIGYLLTGLVAYGEAGTSAMLYYLLGYAVTMAGLFGIALAVEAESGTTDLDAFNGLAARKPFFAWAGVIFFLSLIGIPPTVGFFGKFFLFQALAQQGYLWLAVVMAINAAISVGYYYGVVKRMFFNEGITTEPLKSTFGLRSAVTIAVIGTVLIGLWASPFLSWTHQAAAFFVP